MKQLIFALPILFFSVFSDSRMLSAQVKLVQIEPSAQKFKIPVAKRVINGKYYMEYETLSNLIDSLGLNIGADSIYMAADTIKLRDGSGYVVLKDTSNTNELAKYQEGTSFVGVPKQGDLWYDNKVTSGIPNNRIYIYNNGSWQLLKHRDLYRQIGFDDAYTNECHEIIEFNQPLQGVPPLRHITKTNGPIKMSSSTDYGLAEHVTTTTISIDTADLVNIILDSILTPTPSADSTSVLAGYGITVTETPSNTFTIKADTSKLATQYDLTLKENALTFASPLSRLGNTISIPAASTSASGHLTSTDWNTFNSKIGGNGVSTQAAYFNSNNTLTSNNQLFYVNSLWNMRGSFDLRYSDNNYTLAIGQGAANYPYGTGIDNVYIGRSSGRVNTSGQLNLGLGVNSLYSNTIGNSNIAIGTNSLFTNQSGNYNVAIGQSSLGATNGIDNIGIGFGAAGIIGNSNYNVAIGHTAMGIVSGDNKDYNIAIGWRSLYQSTGYNNTSIGSWAGYNAGNSNINIGYQAGFNNSGNDKLYIENTSSETPLLGGHFDSNKVGINKSINNISSTLHVGGDATIDNLAGTGTRMVVANSTGTLSTQAIPSGGSGATQYLNAYIDNSDTLGFYMTVAQDTVVFRGVDNVSGEATTVGDTPTIDMTLTGTTITASVVDGSITPAKLSQTYLTSEVDGSVSNELQTLSINNNQLSITGGNTVTLPSGGSTEWASLDYGTQAANTQSFTSSVWNTINFLGSNESNSAIINANHTNDDIEFVVAGNYKIDYAVSFVANADALIYMGLHSSVTNDVPFKTQIEGDTDVGYKTCQMSKSIIYSATAGEKLKLQIQPLTAHTSVGVYAHFIITKL